jgi:hypothetical protein
MSLILLSLKDYATALSLGSAGVSRPAHPEQAIVFPGQPVR